jgi:hypothetical protein
MNLNIIIAGHAGLRSQRHHDMVPQVSALRFAHRGPAAVPELYWSLGGTRIPAMLPEALTVAARRAEARLQEMGVRSRKVLHAEWAVLPPEVQRLIPAWIPVLMEQHAMLGLVMEIPHKTWRRFYPFWSPGDFRDVLLSGDPIMEEEIIAHGFVPISNESDGDQWITRLDGDANSPIFLFSHTAMERLPMFASMAELMTLMSVSEESTNEA